MVPTPSAASAPAFSRAMNAVSTNPVSGSATRDNNTGSVKLNRVRCGRTKKGWSAGLAIFPAAVILHQLFIRCIKFQCLIFIIDGKTFHVEPFKQFAFNLDDFVHPLFVSHNHYF
jgi:hypothetical protein